MSVVCEADAQTVWDNCFKHVNTWPNVSDVSGDGTIQEGTTYTFTDPKGTKMKMTIENVYYAKEWGFFWMGCCGMIGVNGGYTLTPTGPFSRHTLVRYHLRFTGCFGNSVHNSEYDRSINEANLYLTTIKNRAEECARRKRGQGLGQAYAPQPPTYVPAALSMFQQPYPQPQAMGYPTSPYATAPLDQSSVDFSTTYPTIK